MEPSTLPLEAELAEIAERAEPGRTARLAVRHWGRDGRGGAREGTAALLHHAEGVIAGDTHEGGAG